MVRDVSIEGNTFDIEIFSTDRKDGQWLFRKQADIHAPIAEAILTSPVGVRYLAPQYVLMYKAWFHPMMEKVIQDNPTEADFIHKCWETDGKDFQTALPLLSNSQRTQLKELFTEFTPDISWLKSL
jgi:hypothetical protein